MTGRRITAGLMVVASCVAGSSQTVEVDLAPAPSARFPSPWYPPESDVAFTTAPVKGEPYMGVMVTTTALTDPKTGRVITTIQKSRQMRDSLGRTRTETPFHVGQATDEDRRETETVLVQVSDTVPHCGFHWVEPWSRKESPVASVTCMSPRLHYGKQASIIEKMKQPATETKEASGLIERSEPLGERTFDGRFKALGMKSIRRSGSDGASATAEYVTEFWYSPKLQEMVAGRIQAQRFELTDIQEVEPDSSRFYPPAGYKIVPGY